MTNYRQAAVTSFYVFRRALRLIWAAAPRLASLSMLLNLGLAALPLGVFYLTKLLIDYLVAGLAQGDLGLDLLLKLLLGLGGLWLLQALIGILAHWVQASLQLRFTDYIAGIIQEKSVQLDLAYYENASLQDTFHKAQREGAYRPMQLLQAVQQLLQSGFFLLLLSIWLWQLAWWLVFILLLAGLPALLSRVQLANKSYQLDKSKAQLDRESWHLHELLTQREAAREVRVFGLGNHFRAKYVALRQQLLADKEGLLQLQSRYDILGQLLEITALLGLIGWVALKTLAGLLTVGSLVMYLQAFQRGQAQLKAAFSATASLYGHRLFLRYLFDFLDTEARIVDPPQAKLLPQPLRQGFSIQNLSFYYPEQNKAALDNISVDLPFGQRIAIVGANGSGKSTLVRLLARLYDPSNGAIFLDGENIKNFALRDLRSSISLVFQDFYRYAFTVQENIALGKVQAPLDADRVKEVAEQIGISRKIEQLPLAYEQPLGFNHSGGQELSGGEWQQIAIARALYADRPILILDEPMSAIDPLIERRILDQLFAMQRDQLILFVTHRLHHLRQADQILVMEAGRIVETGSFEELMEQQGVFYTLFQGG